MGSAKKSISLPEKMYREALARAKRMGYESFSEYVQYLVRRDLEERPTHALVREEPKKDYAGDDAVGKEEGAQPNEPGKEGKIGFHSKKKGSEPRSTGKKFHRIYRLDHRDESPPRDTLRARDLAQG